MSNTTTINSQRTTMCSTITCKTFRKSGLLDHRQYLYSWHSSRQPQLFFFQPSNLVFSTDSNKKHISGLGEIQDYLLFYIAMVLYSYILATLLFVTFQFKTFKKILKQAFLFDHLFLAMLAADITYIGLHTLTFGTIYNSNEQTQVLEPHIMGGLQNSVVMLLYCVANLVATFCIRIIILSVIGGTGKLLALNTDRSLISFVFHSRTNLSLWQICHGQSYRVSYEQNQLQIIELFANQSSSKFSQIPYYLNQNTSLKEHATIVDNFTIVYLIAYFTFFFELVHKITQFDGTNELKTYYRFVRDQQQHR